MCKIIAIIIHFCNLQKLRNLDTFLFYSRSVWKILSTVCVTHLLQTFIYNDFFLLVIELCFDNVAQYNCYILGSTAPDLAVDGRMASLHLF